MSELLRLIDAWKDRHGQPPDASVARGIGIAPQTLSSWRHRGIRELPAYETLTNLAEFLKVDNRTVVLAAMADIGYWPSKDGGGGDDAAGSAASMNG